MTNTDEAKLSGEARLKTRRRKFFRYFTIAMIVAAAAGLLSGLATSMYEDGALPIWVPILATIVVVAGFVWFSWDYFKRIDEIDLQDNLWANTIGMYVGVITFAAWWFVADLGLVDTPPAIAIVGIMFAATMVVYGLRKLNFR